MTDESDRRGGTADLLRGDQATTEENGQRHETMASGGSPAQPHTSEAMSGQHRTGNDQTPLLTQDQLNKFRQRWEQSQRDFVDEPRRSVKTADELVADVVRQLAEGFSSERSMLESQWDRGEDVSTDELRTAFQRYRSFFNRLLEV